MAWVIWVMALAAWVGVWWVTGAMPTETALLTWASWVVMRAGRWAACQPAGSRLLIFADMTVPGTALTLAMTPPDRDGDERAEEAGAEGAPPDPVGLEYTNVALTC